MSASNVFLAGVEGQAEGLVTVKRNETGRRSAERSATYHWLGDCAMLRQLDDLLIRQRIHSQATCRMLNGVEYMNDLCWGALCKHLLLCVSWLMVWVAEAKQ
jgi:hypothetical protein